MVFPIGFLPKIENKNFTLYTTNPDDYSDSTLNTINVEAAGLYPEPVAYLSMDNADLLTISSTYILEPISGYNGLITGGSITTGSTGAVGQAFTFGGINDQRVDLANSNYLDFSNTDGFSLSAWFNTSNSDMALMAKLDSNAGDSTTGGYMLFMGGSGALFFDLRNFNNTLRSRISTASTFNDGAWHHVIATKAPGTAVASSLKLYVDGQLGDFSINTDTLGSVSISNSVLFTIGEFSQPTTSANIPWNGLLDELAVWNRELTANEVFEVYKRGAQGLKLVE